MVDNYQQKIVALDAVTATTTSQVIPCKGAKKILVWIKRAAHGSGNTVFTVNGTIDDTNYVVVATLVSNLANAVAEGPTRVASVTLSSNTNALYALDLTYFAYSAITVTATETTDGSHSATVYIEY